MQHCRQFFLHGKRLHPCKMPLGVPCIVALLFERKTVVAPVCRFPLGGRVSIPPRLQKPHTGRRTAEKEGVGTPKTNSRSRPKTRADSLSAFSHKPSGHCRGSRKKQEKGTVLRHRSDSQRRAMPTAFYREYRKKTESSQTKWKYFHRCRFWRLGAGLRCR